jgi:hypothetical protein
MVINMQPFAVPAIPPLTFPISSSKVAQTLDEPGKFVPTPFSRGTQTILVDLPKDLQGIDSNQITEFNSGSRKI